MNVLRTRGRIAALSAFAMTSVFLTGQSMATPLQESISSVPSQQATAVSDSSSARVDAAAAAMVPDAIRRAGVLRVGTSFPFPPMEFFAKDGKTPTGIDVDLINEIATRLQLKSEFVNMNWDGLIPALNSGRFEVIAASVGDFEGRHAQA